MAWLAGRQSPCLLQGALPWPACNDCTSTAVSIRPAALAFTDAGPGVQTTGDEALQALARGGAVGDGALCVGSTLHSVLARLALVRTVLFSGGAAWGHDQEWQVPVEVQRAEERHGFPLHASRSAQATWVSGSG